MVRITDEVYLAQNAFFSFFLLVFEKHFFSVLSDYYTTLNDCVHHSPQSKEHLYYTLINNGNYILLCTQNILEAFIPLFKAKKVEVHKLFVILASSHSKSLGTDLMHITSGKRKTMIIMDLPNCVTQVEDYKIPFQKKILPHKYLLMF
jgi:hypothetical protein